MKWLLLCTLSTMLGYSFCFPLVNTALSHCLLLKVPLNISDQFYVYPGTLFK